MNNHLTMKIYGRVQGVYFRSTATKLAQQLNITGFAQNLPDGTVYIEAEGGEGDLRKFLQWCQKGTKNAKVDKVNYEFSSKDKNFKRFEDFSVNY